MRAPIRQLTEFMSGADDEPPSEGRQRARNLITVAAVIGVALLASFVIHALNPEGTLDYPTNVSPEITRVIDNSVDWTIVNLAWFFDGISDNLKIALGQLRNFLLWIPWPIVVALVFIIGWRAGDLRIGLASGFGMVAIGFVNLWEATMITVALMMVSVTIAVVVGVPVGVLAARNNLVDTLTRPVLDAMQTMPSFVYLVPGIMLFGLGNVAAILAIVLYAIPPCIRFTNLGIRQVDPSVVEAGRSFGSSPLQLLLKIQVPMAIPTIMAGINQTVMMALAMATIAAMVGAGGLGIEVLRPMGQLEEGRAFVAGASIVVMAIIIDRISQGYILSRDTRR